MLRSLGRLIKIISVGIYYGLDQVVLPRMLSPSVLLKIFPTHRKLLSKPLGNRLCLCCISLGPLFIKLGQMVSIRHDLFSDDIVIPLARLQDNVPPFDTDLAVSTIESSFNKPLYELFLAFNPKPIASASIAQVYEATLPGGENVVVKVLRPKLEVLIKRDIRLMRLLARLICFVKRWNQYTLQSLIDQYAYTLEQEADLTKEACHYSQMRHNFENDNRLFVPKVYWKHTNQQVLTVERIHGIPMAEANRLPKRDRKRLAENGVSIFFTQVFKHRFFHADMHPGNMFIIPKKPPQFAACDFGIVGTLNTKDQYYLAENFLAFHKRDYMKIAKLHIEAGWVSEDTSLIQFESAIRHVCEPIFSKPLEEISIAELLIRVVRACRPFNLKMQPQLLLLQKTLFYVEAMGRSLYPQLNLWEASEPFVQSYMRERTSPISGFNHLKAELPRLYEIAPKLPFLLKNKLEKQENSNSTLYEFFSYGLISGILLSNKHLLTLPPIFSIVMAGLITIKLCRWVK